MCRRTVAAVVVGIAMLCPARVILAHTSTLCSLPVDTHRANLCLPPQDLARSDRAFRIAIDPTSLVERETNLRLTQVVLRGHWRPFGIIYVYGRLPVDQHQMLDYGLQRPKFMVVGEVETNRGTIYAPPRLGLSLPPATWNFGAVVLRRRWSLDLTSNLPKRTVRRLGWTLVRRARARR